MKHLFQHRGMIRKNLVTLIGIGLCCYFSYHLIQGQRSAIRFFSLEQTISRMQDEQIILKEKRIELENQVAMLRPNSINKDLLEERARIVLGFRKSGEMDVMNTQ